LGDPAHTPNLDKLAKSVVLFTNVCSAQPVNSPHKAMLMSGMYSSKNGIKANCTIDKTEELKHDIVCLTDDYKKVMKQRMFKKRIGTEHRPYLIKKKTIKELLNNLEVRI
jgi:hypothetical protein